MASLAWPGVARCQSFRSAHRLPPDRMPSVHIDLPIFIGPDVALGHFGIDVMLERMPRKDEPFPWPNTWLGSHRGLFMGQSHQVWALSECEGPGPEIHFNMFGLVCSNRAEALAVVRHIEGVESCVFDEY
jgi:hypothetical protein